MYIVLCDKVIKKTIDYVIQYENILTDKANDTDKLVPRYTFEMHKIT